MIGTSLLLYLLLLLLTTHQVFQGTEGGYASALRLERNDGTIAAAEAQRAVLAMARKV
jgi:hypothetical protein